MADTNATQNEVDKAADDLEDAFMKLQKAKVNRSDLEDAINNAINLDDITESNDGNDVIDPNLWATAEDKQTYEEALDNAKKVLADPIATQNDVDNALETLQDALDKIKVGNAVYITYNPNGGVIDGDTASIDQIEVKGDTIAIREAPTREGYNFLYWQGSEYYPGDNYKVVDHHTFTAIWEKKDDPKPEPTPGPSPEPTPKPEPVTPSYVVPRTGVE